MIKLRLLWPFCFVLILYSCKGRKKLAAPTEVVKISDSASRGKTVSAENLLNNTLKDWKYFSSKVKVDYFNGTDNQNFGSSIRMYKDSLIWISINLFGIEGARILINKDSMVMYNKLDKNYKVYRKELIESILGAPLAVVEIQNVILAQPVFPLKLYEIIMNDENYLKIKNEQPSAFINHLYQKKYLTIDSTLIEVKTRPQYAQINYTNFVIVNEHNFPLNNRIHAHNGVSQVQIDLEFENPDFQTELSFPFTIPSSYDRIK